MAKIKSTEFFMVIPKKIAKELKIEGRQFPARSRKVVKANVRSFFGTKLGKKIKIKKRIVHR